MLARKEFDKKYDDAFDDFRTSGSMPSIPSISEQYASAASFAREKGVDVKEGDPTFGKRLTEKQEALKKEQEEGLQSYNELKAELLENTAYVGMLGLTLFVAFAPNDSSCISYAIGKHRVPHRDAAVLLEPFAQTHQFLSHMQELHTAHTCCTRWDEK